MDRYKVFKPESWFWIENEKEIRALAEDVNKAIDIVVRRWRRLWPYTIYPIDVSGGCHERDTSYEMFSGGSYPLYDRDTDKTWVDMLVDDFRKEEERLDGCWFSILCFDTITVVIIGHRGPVVLTFYRGEMAVTICYDDEYKAEEKELLDEFERVFGRA